MQYLSKIYIQLKESILDPQGQAVLHALHNQNQKDVKDIRIGKYIEMKLDAPNEELARQQVQKHCEFLANPVIESYHFELEPIK